MANVPAASSQTIFNRGKHSYGKVVHSSDEKGRSVCHTRVGRVIYKSTGDKTGLVNSTNMEFPTVRAAKFYMDCLTQPH